MKRILVLGAGFIGNHLVNRLKKMGHHVIGVDIKYPEFSTSSLMKSRPGLTAHLIQLGKYFNLPK